MIIGVPVYFHLPGAKIYMWGINVPGGADLKRLPPRSVQTKAVRPTYIKCVNGGCGVPEHWEGTVRLAPGVQEIKMKVTFEPGLERQVADCWFQSYKAQGK